MGAETVLEILDAAPWVRNEQYNFVFVPATKHSVLRKGLAQRGFALKSETLCRAAGRLYTVINAQYTGRVAEPTGLACHHRNLTALFLSGTICNMCQNLKQPGFQTVLTAKITDVQICCYKGFLKNVLRILTVSQNQ